MDLQIVQDVLEWDVASWAPALAFWEAHLEGCAGSEVLDVGARRGGLSLHFALKGCRVVCSDLKGPSEKARLLHERYGIAQRIIYASADATRIPFPDDHFDIVCSKSVLGGISRELATIQRAVSEIHRVLKPGGKYLFAENLKATVLHMLGRRLFLTRNWRYLRVSEMLELLSSFAQVDLAFNGFLAAFGRNERQRRMLNRFDRLIKPLVPNSACYIAFGCAQKSGLPPADQIASSSRLRPVNEPRGSIAR